MQLDDEDIDNGSTIEAFKELSLQRDRRAEIRGGERHDKRQSARSERPLDGW